MSPSIRVETDRGVLLFWPPHNGVLYSIAGPVSYQVPIVIVGTEKAVAGAFVPPAAKARYQITTRAVDRTPRKCSLPIPVHLMTIEDQSEARSHLR